MKYPEFKTISMTITKEQNEWLSQQCQKQGVNKSELIRFAIKKLFNAIEQEHEIEGGFVPRIGTNKEK